MLRSEHTEEHLLPNDMECVIVDGLTNLAQLPQRFAFVGFPLNKGRDGSPFRVVALVED